MDGSLVQSTENAVRTFRLSEQYELPSANIINGLVVHHEGTVRVLECGVRGQDGVVRLHHGRGHLRSGIHGELQLGLLAVVDREALHEEGGETGPGATAKGVEDQEALESGALLRLLPHLLQDHVHDLLADGVVSAGVVIGRVLLT